MLICDSLLAGEMPTQGPGSWTCSLHFHTVYWARGFSKAFEIAAAPVLLPGEPMGGGAWRATVYGVAESWTWLRNFNYYYSVQFSRSVVSDSLRPHEPEHARPPCPSPAPRAYPNSCPLCRWCHPTILSSVVPFSSHLQSFPASGSFQMSHFFPSGGQRIGVSASHQSFQWIFRTDFL